MITKEHKRAIARAWYHANKGRTKERGRENALAWYYANKEKAALSAKRFNEANPDYKKAWREANKEHISKYHKANHAANREEINRTHRERYQENKEHVAIRLKAYAQGKGHVKRMATKARRRAREKNCCVSWGNEFFIEEIYDLARRRTKMFGYQWDVDHIIPIQSEVVCGLHWEGNLQVIPHTENLKTLNRLHEVSLV